MGYSELCFKAWVLSPLGLIKGLLLGSPNAVLATMAVTLITLLRFPYKFFLACKVVWTTAYLGTNVRVLLLLFLPLMSVIALIAIPVLAFLIYFFTNVFLIAFTVFDDDCNEATKRTAEVLIEYTWMSQPKGISVRAFNRVLSSAAEEVASEMCNIPRYWDGTVYEIPLSKFMIGTSIFVFGTMLGLLFIPLLTVVKAPMGWLRANYEYIQIVTDIARRGSALEVMVYSLFLVLGWALMNALAVPAIFFIGAPLYSLTVGIQCAAEALRTDVISEGWKHAWRLLRSFDQFSTRILVLWRWDDDTDTPSCFPRVSDPLPTAGIISNNPASAMAADQTAGSFEGLFQLFVVQVSHDTTAALQCSWIQGSDVRELAPFVIIGLPAVSIFNILQRSVAVSPGKEELVCPSLPDAITTASKPIHGIVANVCVCERERERERERQTERGREREKESL